MACYLIKTSKSTVSVSTTTGCRARIDGSSGCADQNGSTGSFSFRIYEVTRKQVVGCASSPCSAIHDVPPNYSTVEFGLDCSWYNALTLELRHIYDGYIGASETWKQIFPSQPDAPDRPKDKKVNTNNIVTKQSNQINIKENGNFLGIPGDIEIKTDIPAAEPLAINKVKNVGLFLTQNETNDTPQFLAFKQMIQDLSTTLPEHYRVIIPVPTGNPVFDCEPQPIPIAFSLSPCQRIDAIMTVTNNFNVPAQFYAEGSCNDEIIFNGQIYEEREHIFPWYQDFCGLGLPLNGSHDFTYSKILQPGESITIGSRDNGLGGGTNGYYTLCPQTYYE